MCPTEQSDDEPAESTGTLSPEDTGEWPIPEASPQAQEPESLSSLQESRSALPEPEKSTPPASSAVDSIPRIMAAISQLGGMVEQRLSTLQSLFDREVRAEATRERIVDRLHAELQEYKQDLLLKVQRPIFIDLIQLHDDIGKMIEAQPAEDADQAAAVWGTLESIRTAILDILYRQGVEPFQTEGDEFDPRRQRAVTTAPVDEPGQNRTIAGRLRPGFQAGEKIIRAEMVSVYTLRACNRLP
ncbi:MAG: nucleotide exchange factor GrpE [Isosphaeraceae bacterium]